MLQTTRGVVLRTTRYRETSLIARIYTENFGLHSYIIGGARGKKKSKAALFQPLTLVELVAYQKEKDTLSRIRDIRCTTPFTTIHDDIIKTTLTLFIAELLNKTIREDIASGELFGFLSNALIILDMEERNCANFHLLFMLRLTRHLGFYPQDNHSAIECVFDLENGHFCPGKNFSGQYLDEETSRKLAELLDSTFQTMDQLKINNIQRKALLHGLLQYYRFHLPAFGELKSHSVLETVVS